MVDCVAAMKEVLGDKVGLALDCGPGWMPADAIRFARAIEHYNVMWLRGHADRRLFHLRQRPDSTAT